MGALKSVQDAYEQTLEAGIHVADPFKTSIILRSFYLQCQCLKIKTGATSWTTPEDGIENVVRVRDEMLVRDDFFEILRTIVPDFLKSRNRFPLHPVGWKHIWV